MRTRLRGRELGRMRLVRGQSYRRFGKFYQLEVGSVSDLRSVLELDEASWAATSADITMIRTDQDFLTYLDTDHDGRIMCHEIKDAIRWLLAVLSDNRAVEECRDWTSAQMIQTESPEGKALQSALTAVLPPMGREAGVRVSLAEIREFEAALERTPKGAFGVVLPEAAEDERQRAFLADIVKATGGVPHPAGGLGVDSAGLEKFLKAANAYLQWRAGGLDRLLLPSLHS